MVVMWWMPNLVVRMGQMAEVNWAPRSDASVSGTPNLEIHPLIMASAQEVVDVHFSRIASAHRVDLSTMVKR